MIKQLSIFLLCFLALSSVSAAYSIGNIPHSVAPNTTTSYANNTYNNITNIYQNITNITNINADMTNVAYTNESYASFWYNMTTIFTNWLSTFEYNYNQTGLGGGGNSSFNQTLTDSLYAEKQWNYNQTQPFSDWLATFVSNIFDQSLNTTDNVRFNQTIVNKYCVGDCNVTVYKENDYMVYEVQTQ